MVENIKEAFDSAERIGVIGSPSSTGGLTIDILGTAVNKRLVGHLSIFHYIQEGKDHYALGQITKITMQNIWTQDPTMRGLIRQKGRVDPITERQDVHTAEMLPSSVFCRGSRALEPSILGTVPSTGASIKLVNENIMDALLADYMPELFYLGRAYGTDVKMPMWFKHFGDPQKEPGGIGEAYHIGIFGKTGSGKSVLAKMMLAVYARHKKMSIFILDPQGEYSHEFLPGTKVRRIMEAKLGRHIRIFNLQNLVFDYSDDLFRSLLIASGFFDKLKLYYGEHPPRFFEEFIHILGGKGTLYEEIKPWYYYKREAFDRIWEQIPTDAFLKKIIASPAPKERVKVAWQDLNADEMYSIWSGTANLFRYKSKDNVRLTELFGKMAGEGAFAVIDISSRDKPEDVFWNEEIQLIAIQQFLSRITTHAEEQFKEGGNLNSLVVIDEAHRLAPREKTENENITRIKILLTDAVRTTRKYGLGWMFISQTLSSLDREIINQIRIYIFGFGLGWGMERRALLDIIGGQTEALSLYQMFRDPQSGLGEREYPFMTIGPISPLSFSSAPLFFTALEYPDEFLRINDKLWW
ncbi:MAG: DUF87 domain-containing protein [Nitrospiraceae bacterium]|nr:DUF87 domain-containing protein [Nitrospiraceae bacterium]